MACTPGAGHVRGRGFVFAVWPAASSENFGTVMAAPVPSGEVWGQRRTLGDVEGDKALGKAVQYMRRDMGVCNLCCIRMLNVRGDTIAKQTPGALEQILAPHMGDQGGQDSPQASNPNHCPLCWGIFNRLGDWTRGPNTKEEIKEGQEPTPSALSLAAAAFEEKGYDAKSFSTGITVPPSLDLREQGAYVHLTKQFPDTFPSVPPQVAALSRATAQKRRCIGRHSAITQRVVLHGFTYLKEVLNDVFRTGLATRLGLQHDIDSAFRVNIAFSLPAVEASDIKMGTPLIEGAVPAETTSKPWNPQQKQERRRRKRKRRNIFSRSTIMVALETLTQEAFLASGFAPPPAIPKSSADEFLTTVSCASKPVFLRGWYMKLKRGISQTPWAIGPERELKTEQSVKGEITRHIMPLFKSESSKFHSGGREDVDVRMLGHGRPFVLELAEPRRRSAANDAATMRCLQDKVNAGSNAVKIRKLELCDDGRAELLRLSAAAEDKKKRYRAVVCLSAALSREEVEKRLDSVSELKVAQRTPVRVLHRRVSKVRAKVIHSIRVHKWYSERVLAVDMVTSAGTYVKEFVHGDRGRTQPCLGDLLGCETDIAQLDVLEIMMPPADTAI